MLEAGARAGLLPCSLTAIIRHMLCIGRETGGGRESAGDGYYKRS